jgi:hypothetical protein
MWCLSCATSQRDGWTATRRDRTAQRRWCLRSNTSWLRPRKSGLSLAIVLKSISPPADYLDTGAEHQCRGDFRPSVCLNALCARVSKEREPQCARQACHAGGGPRRSDSSASCTMRQSHHGKRGSEPAAVRESWSDGCFLNPGGGWSKDYLVFDLDTIKQNRRRGLPVFPVEDVTAQIPGADRRQAGYAGCAED